MRRFLPVVVLLVTLFFTKTSNAADPKIELSLDRQLGDMVTALSKYNRMVETDDDVTLGLGVDSACAANALRKTYAVLAETDGVVGTVRSFKATLDSAKLGIPVGRLGEAAEIVVEYLESTDAADFEQRLQQWAAKQIAKGGLKGGLKSLLPPGVGQDFDDTRTIGWILDHAIDAVTDALKQAPLSTERAWNHPQCDGKMTFQLVPPTNGAAGAFTFVVQGDCRCQWPHGSPVELGQFVVHGEMLLNARAVVNGKDVAIVISGEVPRYFVDKAVCNACGGSAGGRVVVPAPETPSTPTLKVTPVLQAAYPECEKWALQESGATLATAQQDAALPDLKRKLAATEADVATRKERLARAESERFACTSDLKSALTKPNAQQTVTELDFRCTDLAREVRFLKDYISRAEATGDRQRDEVARAERARAYHEKEIAEARAKKTQCERMAYKPKKTSWLGPRIEMRVGPVVDVVKNDRQVALAAAGSVGVLDNGRGRISASVQMHALIDETTLLVPIGYEHVVPIGSSAVTLVPRVSGGYAFQSFTKSSDKFHYGVVLPELGLHVAITDRLVFGIDPGSFPVLINKSGASVFWRPTFMIGLTL